MYWVCAGLHRYWKRGYGQILLLTPISIESSWPYRLRKSHTNLVRNDNQYLGCQEIVYTIQRVATNTSGIAKLHIVVHRHEIRCLLALGHGIAQLVVWLDLTSNRVSITY